MSESNNPFDINNYPEQWWLDRTSCIEVYEHFDWNETEVHKATGIPRGTLANGRRKHGIHLPKSRGDSRKKRRPVINPGIENSIEERLRREFENREERLKISWEKEKQDLVERPRIAEPSELADARRQVMIAQNRYNNEKKIADELVRKADIVSNVKELMVPYLAELQLPAVKKPELIKKKNNPISLLVSLNDWHWGKSFDAVMTSGLNAYNPYIAAARAQRVSDVVTRWADNFEQMGNPVECLYVVLNGDMSNGNLHPEDESNYAGAIIQIADCSLVIAQILTEWSHRFPRIVVVKPSGDNHLRTTKKSVTSAKAYDTGLDTIMALTISSLTMGTKHIEYSFDRAHQTLLSVYGRTWAICHGNLIKGGGGSLGIPAYGMKRHENANFRETVAIAKRCYQDIRFDSKATDIEKLEQLMGVLGGIVDYTLLAHFHNRNVLGNCYIAPTMMGADPYAKDIIRAGDTPAQQMFWALHPEQGIMGEYFVNCQDIMDPESKSRYYWGMMNYMGGAGQVMNNWVDAQ